MSRIFALLEKDRTTEVAVAYMQLPPAYFGRLSFKGVVVARLQLNHC